jgi:hypothetical protein
MHPAATSCVENACAIGSRLRPYVLAELMRACAITSALAACDKMALWQRSWLLVRFVRNCRTLAAGGVLTPPTRLVVRANGQARSLGCDGHRRALRHAAWPGGHSAFTDKLRTGPSARCARTVETTWHILMHAAIELCAAMLVGAAVTVSATHSLAPARGLSRVSIP